MVFNVVIRSFNMNIQEIKVQIRHLADNYQDNDENGVVAFHGDLNVRPPYQREFIYTPDKQKKVIDTIIKGYPLNVFYWGTTSISGRYELIDGQQRTCSICDFVSGKYSIQYGGNDCTFSALPHDIQDRILDYELTVYKCDGNDSEKLAWFETINIASEALTPQELRNAVYTGAWLADAKRYFSKTNCPAINLGKDYLKGSPIRQEVLEEVLKWAADSEGLKIDTYMAAHKDDNFPIICEDHGDYFTDVINWVKSVFTDTYKDMKNVKWGILYNKYHEKCTPDEKGNILCSYYSDYNTHSHSELLKEIQRLHDDEDVTSVQGIYEYVLSGDERKISIRKFPDKIKMKIYKQQGGLCKHCGKAFDFEDMVGDHITPWSKGGKTVEGNCQLLCVTCNSKKSNKTEKADNQAFCVNCGKLVTKGMFCQFCGTKN